MLCPCTAALASNHGKLRAIPRAALNQPAVSSYPRAHLGASAMRIGRNDPETWRPPSAAAAAAASSWSSSNGGSPVNSCCSNRTFSRSMLGCMMTDTMAVRQGRSRPLWFRPRPASRLPPPPPADWHGRHTLSEPFGTHMTWPDSQRPTGRSGRPTAAAFRWTKPFSAAGAL